MQRPSNGKTSDVLPLKLFWLKLIIVSHDAKNPTTYNRGSKRKQKHLARVLPDELVPDFSSEATRSCEHLVKQLVGRAAIIVQHERGALNKGVGGDGSSSGLRSVLWETWWGLMHGP
jgi:hypothetical protein